MSTVSSVRTKDLPVQEKLSTILRLGVAVASPGAQPAEVTVTVFGPHWISFTHRFIHKDDGILIAGLAANWDESVFPDPEELDFHRGVRSHVAFGYGVHQCLGQNLARLELEIVFETLFRRVPGLRLAVPADELPYKTDANVYGIHHVPVNF